MRSGATCSSEHRWGRWAWQALRSATAPALLPAGQGRLGHRAASQKARQRWEGVAGQEEGSGCPLCTGHWHRRGRPEVALGRVTPGQPPPPRAAPGSLLAPGPCHVPPGTPCTWSPQSCHGRSGRDGAPAPAPSEGSAASAPSPRGPESS